MNIIRTFHFQQSHVKRASSHVKSSIQGSRDLLRYQCRSSQVWIKRIKFVINNERWIEICKQCYIRSNVFHMTRHFHVSFTEFWKSKDTLSTDREKCTESIRCYNFDEIFYLHCSRLRVHAPENSSIVADTA